MAHIIGTSGSWKAIVDMLVEIGLRAEQPEDIQALLTEQKNQLAQRLSEAQKKIQLEMEPVAEEIQIQKENIEKGPANRLAELEEDIQEARLHLELFRLDKSLFGRVGNLFRIHREEKKLHKREQARDEIVGRLNRLLGEQDKILAERRAAIEAEAVSEYKDINIKVTTLQETLDSKELGTAMLELEMLGHLSALPDDAWVLNGIRLEADSAVRLDGKSFLEARIDHLVITPSGLFAIEVQPGGKQSSEGDPFEQIRRAAHLCHELLKYDFPEITVRAVLAHRSPMPESQQNAYVKTLALPDVAGYINWFKDKSLSAERIEKIATYLGEIGI